MASMHEGSAGEPRQRARPGNSSPLRMARLIEGEIIPRLLLAHRADREITVPLAPAFASGEPLAFAHRALDADVYDLLAVIETHLARGVSIDAVYLDLLAPTARVLGDFWDNDICDFVDVTMAMWRLQQVIHELGNRASCPSARTRADRRALFTVPPGDQHSMGLVMIEDFFRRAGWRTWSAADASLTDLQAIVGRQWLELIGVTVSTGDHLDRLATLVRDLRAASANKAVVIMVGGRIFTEHPDLATQVGADGTAADATLALRLAERLVDGRPALHGR